jgi:hypothetical protein
MTLTTGTIPLALTLGLMMTQTLANPQPAQEVITESRTVSCLNKDNMYRLVGEFDEIPFIRALHAPVLGVANFNSLVIFVNSKTGSFTIVERVEEQKYCVLAVGGAFEPVPAEALREYNRSRDKELRKRL